MKTLEVAKAIAAELRVENSTESIYRHLIVFAVNRDDGYGVNDGPRWEARRYAESNGFFWLPCILCGEWHGGHEISHGSSVMLNSHRGVCVCGNCKEEAKRINKLWPNGIGE